ncbi:hypothetical protein Tco_0160985, partial [Tanacetum coccineum]
MTQVLLFNSRLKMFSGKLKSRWSGPFTIAHVFPYGTVELSQNSGPNFKVNGHRINTTLEGTYHPWLSRISKPSPRTNEFRDWVKLSDPKQALRGRQPTCLSVVILCRLSRIFEASRAHGFVLRSQELQVL